MNVAAIFGAVFFAVLAYIGVLLANGVAANVKPLEGGPPPNEPPTLWLVAACGIIGAVVSSHSSSAAQIVLTGFVCAALAAAWCVDARTGLIPDGFTLVPLAALVLVSLWQHQWSIIIAACVPLIPFALAALLSHGRGMGWGDVRLAALGGAVLGAQTAVLVFALACVVAVAVAYARKRTKSPIAFGPYLVAAIGIALPIGMLV